MRLPDDILLSIFPYLSYPEIISSQRVSRSWRDYVLSEPALHTHVSFLESKHPIPLRTIRAAISIAQNRILSLEFDARTLMYLTPFSTIFPYLEHLVIRQEYTGYLSTIFHIMFLRLDGSFHPLPRLRTVIFRHGALLSNELIILLAAASNLETLECRSARVNLDYLELLDEIAQWKLKKLRIEHYSESVSHSPLELVMQPTQRAIRSPAILRFLPYLEELTLGVDAFQVMDLTMNQRMRYLDFLPQSAIVSFIQPPPCLKVCLNAPMLCRHLPDSRPTIWPPGNEASALLHNRIQLWTNPPAFETLSISRVPADIAILPRALCNSYDSLVALRLSFAWGVWSLRETNSEDLINQHMEQLPKMLCLFKNLRFLDVSESSYVGDTFLARTPVLSLEYLCLARTSVTSKGVTCFLSKARATLREINVMETMVGEEIRDVAANLGVKMEIKYPGRVIYGS
jgi:hypothetical protein